MFKRLLVMTLLVVTSHFSMAEQDTAESAQSNGAYIVDNLFVYVHSGPGKNYRILGSVEAGSDIQLLDGNDNGYQQIIDDKGREVWVESKYVSTQAGLAQQLKNAEQSLTQAQQALVEAQTELPNLQQQNQSLQSENSSLQQTIAELKQQIDNEKQQAQQVEQQEQHLMLTYGGGIGIGGLLIGVVLTLFLSRRKRYDSWA